MQEMFTKDLEELKNKQVNNTLEGINSRITEAKEWISDLENRMAEITASEQNIENNEDSLRDLWDNIKHTNIYIRWIPEEDKDKGPEKIFEEIIAENFPNMGKEVINQVQEAQSPRRNKTKGEHTETHGNQTDKN